MTTTSSGFYGHGKPTKGPDGQPILPVSEAQDESRFLGKTTTYSKQYDASLLQPVPRQENRTTINITDDDLPFVGFDIWNAYEFSCLKENGVPITGILKLKYPANSKNIVESKSLKLYLNSFNMTKIIRSEQEKNDAVSYEDIITDTINTDLSKILECDVEVTLFFTGEYNSTAYMITGALLEDCVDLDEFTEESLKYNEDPSLLEVSRQLSKVDMDYTSHLLRSNCKVTHQPDWGTVFIHYTGNTAVFPESLARYLISFRNESHFHEEICETIYKRLYDALEPDDLVVACFYTRRGGIDINPIRCSSKELEQWCAEEYGPMDKLSAKTDRQ